MKNKVIRKLFFPLILAKDQKDCDGFGKIKNEIRKKKNKERKDGATGWTRTSDPHHVKVVL